MGSYNASDTIKNIALFWVCFTLIAILEASIFKQETRKYCVELRAFMLQRRSKEVVKERVKLLLSQFKGLSSQWEMCGYMLLAHSSPFLGFRGAKLRVKLFLPLQAFFK